MEMQLVDNSSVILNQRLVARKQLCVQGGLATETKMDLAQLRVEDGLATRTKVGRAPSCVSRVELQLG